MSQKRKLSCIAVTLSVALVAVGGARGSWTNDDELSAETPARLPSDPPPDVFQVAQVRTSPELSPPVRLEADGRPINIGKLSSIAHAGPAVADVDGDGDRDLLVGDFPGYFWLFENTGSDDRPVYTGRGKLKAGGEDAKTPVY